MTSEQFIAWAMERPETSIRVGNAVEQRGPTCSVYIDDIVVRVDGETSFEPDVVVRCGVRPDPNALWIDDPVILVEVLSPSTRGVDKARKFAAYMQLPSVRHCLIVDVEKRTVIRHRRDDAGEIATRIVSDVPLMLDPPGLLLDRIFDPPG